MVDEYNRGVLKNLKKGDLVEFPKGLYSHWAVYVGDEHVVHLTGVEIERLSMSLYNHPGDVFRIGGELFKIAEVQKDTFDKAANGSRAKINNDKDKIFRPKPVQEIVKTANDQIGVIGYNVFWNNCESFANFCRYGNKQSDQGVYAWGIGFKFLEYIWQFHTPNSKRTRITRINLTNNRQEEPNKLIPRLMLKIQDGCRAFLNK